MRRIEDRVVIECGTCVMRDSDACGDCLVTAMWQGRPGRLELDREEQAAVIELQVAGLVPLVRYRPA